MVKRTKKGRKTSARALMARKKQAQALQLRIEGLSLDEIARRVGYRHRQGVDKAINTELARHTVDNVKQLRELEQIRLGLVMARHLLIAASDPMPDLRDETKDLNRADAIARQISRSAMIVDRISARVAKLMGLDASTKVELGGSDGNPLLSLQVNQLDDQAFAQLVERLDRQAEQNGSTT